MLNLQEDFRTVFNIAHFLLFEFLSLFLNIFSIFFLRTGRFCMSVSLTQEDIFARMVIIAQQ